uniref:Uncharacterized protein n=1 Tax=Anguilla anguilla TaxID=7936 RepID=A0A0E9TZU8_ANGAN
MNCATAEGERGCDRRPAAPLQKCAVPATLTATPRRRECVLPAALTVTLSPRRL